MQRARSPDGDILRTYKKAKNLVEELGYGDQVRWLEGLLESAPYRTAGPSEFFREYTWVVFTCGFKADVVRKHWEEIKEMLFGFDPFAASRLTLEQLREKSPIKNGQKLAAILKTAALITDSWLSSLRESASWQDMRALLLDLPFIGKVTVYHLMRNIGVDCYKPDRHISNLSEELCAPMEHIFRLIVSEGEERYTGVADYVLWRACASLGSASALVKLALGGGDAPPCEKRDPEITDYLF